MSEQTRPNKIRVAGLAEEHLREVVATEEACSAMYQEKGITDFPARGAADLIALTKRHNVRIAEADHKVAGYTAWRDESPGVGFVEALAVHPDYQRFGVGTRLVEHVREEAKKVGLGQVLVRAHTSAPWAEAFWKKLGFLPVDDSAPPKVKAWIEEQSANGPVAPPGYRVLWGKV
jgi:N-acetylglutamate synthase-like GNAT family acetyltransferase